MTREERTMIGIQKEIEKLEARKARVESKIQKNITKCEKLGCAEWTEEEYKNRRQVLVNKATEAGSMWIEYEDEILTEKQQSACWDRFISYPRDLEEVARLLTNANRRLEKAIGAYEVKAKQVADLESKKRKNRAIKNIRNAANMYIGSLENALADTDETEELFQQVQRELGDHEHLVKIVYDEAIHNVYTDGCVKYGEDAEAAVKDLRFCGRDFLMEQCDRQVTEMGY